jgi:hypothetical protein
MEHLLNQILPDPMILKAPKREMKTPLFYLIFYHLKKPMFSSLAKVPLKSSNQAASDLCDAPHHWL